MKWSVLFLPLFTLAQTACVFSGGQRPGSAPEDAGNNQTTSGGDVGGGPTNGATNNVATNNGTTTNNQTANNGATNNGTGGTNNGTCTIPDTPMTRICEADIFDTCGELTFPECTEPVPCGDPCGVNKTCRQFLCVGDGLAAPAPFPGGAVRVAYWGPGLQYATSAPDADGTGKVVVMKGTDVHIPTSPVLHVNMEFGADIAGFGNWLLVGAPGARGDDGTSPIIRGQAHLYSVENTGVYEIDSRDGWSIVDVDPSDPLTSPANSEFGAAVAMGGSGGALAPAAFAVGAPGLDRVLVTVATPSTDSPWELVSETVLPAPNIVAEPGFAGSRFGHAVTLSNDGRTLAIGAPGAQKLYLYEFNGDDWVAAETLALAAVGTTGFGAAVALDATGSRLAVADPETSKVKIYERTNDGAWILVESIERGANTSFGEALAFDGPMLLVGQPRGGNGGVVRMFGGGRQLGGYVELAIIAGDTIPMIDRGFGKSLAVNVAQNRFLVGAPAPDGMTSMLWFSGF